VYPDEKTARSVVGERATEARATRLAQQMASRRVSLASMSGQASEGDLKELNLILKADVQGSVEAILGSLEQLPQGEVQVRVLLSAPGEITETDVDLAAASGALTGLGQQQFHRTARDELDDDEGQCQRTQQGGQHQQQALEEVGEHADPQRGLSGRAHQASKGHAGKLADTLSTV
jgi:hypothetical protein